MFRTLVLALLLIAAIQATSIKRDLKLTDLPKEEATNGSDEANVFIHKLDTYILSGKRFVELMMTLTTALNPLPTLQSSITQVQNTLGLIDGQISQFKQMLMTSMLYESDNLDCIEKLEDDFLHLKMDIRQQVTLLVNTEKDTTLHVLDKANEITRSVSSLEEMKNHIHEALVNGNASQEMRTAHSLKSQSDSIYENMNKVFIQVTEGFMKNTKESFDEMLETLLHMKKNILAFQKYIKICRNDARVGSDYNNENYDDFDEEIHTNGIDDIYY